MPADTVKNFLQALQQSQLLSPENWETARTIARGGRQKLAQQKKSATAGGDVELKQLVKSLVDRALLTPWQAAQLQKGQTGFVLGGYRLLHPIGKGGMGHVFKADTFDSDAVVAVKVMARKLTSNESLVSRFRREIKASSKLNSKHVVRTLDAGRVGKVDFMVMEFVNGEQIEDIVSRTEKLPIGMACEMIRHAALGLQHAFEEQMVHRDIKPANLIVHWDADGQGTVKLMDMGLVLLMSDSDSVQQMTRTGQVMGTPDYMSPEQGWDTTNVDIRGDIYSLGCSLFRLLTGTTPFTGTNPLQVLSQRLQRDAPSITSIDPTLPEGVAAVVSKMTRRELASRYQTPAEVAEALSPFCEALTFSQLQSLQAKSKNETSISLKETRVVDRQEDLDEGDVTYQQFLSEVQKGTGVDLMSLTSATPIVLESEIPVVETEPTSALDKTRQRRTKRKRPTVQPEAAGNNNRVRAYLAGGLVAVVLAAIAFVMRDADSSPSDVPEKSLISSVTFSDNQPGEALIGRLFQFQPDVTVGHRAKEASLFYRLVNSPSPSIGIDEDTGEITWLIPTFQPIAPLTLKVEAVEDFKGTETVIGSRDVVINVAVNPSVVSMRMPGQEELLLNSGQPFSTSVAVDSDLHDSVSLVYRMKRSSGEGASLDSDTGLLSWTPGRDDIGRHNLKVSVFDRERDILLDDQTIVLLVMPSVISDVMDEPAELTARPGQLLTYRLGRIRPGRKASGPVRLVLQLGPDSPDGAIILPPDNVFQWQVPSSATGLVQCSLTATVRTVFGNKRLGGTLPLNIRVGSSAATVINKVPSEVVLKPIREEIQSTYERRLSRARSNSDKVSLGRELLIQSYGVSASESDFALLQVIDESLAVPGRSVDLQLEIAELKSGRYGTDELADAVRILKSFSRRSVASSERDLLTERFLKLALKAVNTEQLDLVQSLLKHARSLQPRNASGMADRLSTDLNQASEAVEAVLQESPSKDVRELKLTELKRLLTRWQFQPVFRKSSSIRWFQSSGNAIAVDQLQKLWELEDDAVRLNSGSVAAMVGFVDSSVSSDRFAFRCELMPGSNTAQIIAGLDPNITDQPPGILISVDGANPGRIQLLGQNSVIATPNSANLNVFQPNSANALELIVEGKRIVFKLNGTLISQGVLPQAMPGLIGLGADLKVTGPKVSIRNARILTFPDP